MIIAGSSSCWCRGVEDRSDPIGSRHCGGTGGDGAGRVGVRTAAPGGPMAVLRAGGRARQHGKAAGRAATDGNRFNVEHPLRSSSRSTAIGGGRGRV
jgi:hypothetical protein